MLICSTLINAVNRTMHADTTKQIQPFLLLKSSISFTDTSLSFPIIFPIAKKGNNIRAISTFQTIGIFARYIDNNTPEAANKTLIIPIRLFDSPAILAAKTNKISIQIRHGKNHNALATSILYPGDTPPRHQ